MQIRVLSVSGGVPPVVRAAFAGGELTVEWRGEGRPAPGDCQDVELSFDQEPEWGVDLQLGERQDADDSDALEGQIEVYDEAGMAIRVGDGVVLLDPAGEAPLGACAGAAVTILGPVLSAWPTDV